MAKKKSVAKKNGSQINSLSAGSNKKRQNGASKEIFEVHVIGEKDIENHFGVSDPGGEGRIDPSAAANPKTEVELSLNEKILQEAREEAARKNLELSEYVEAALVNFKDDTGK